MKCAGEVKYPFVAGSPSDPQGYGLGYNTEKEAKKHCKEMNKLLAKWDDGKTWNKNFWGQVKPEKWIVECSSNTQGQ
jgi:hypothetical protein